MLFKLKIKIVSDGERLAIMRSDKTYYNFKPSEFRCVMWRTVDSRYFDECWMEDHDLVNKVFKRLSTSYDS